MRHTQPGSLSHSATNECCEQSGISNGPVDDDSELDVSGPTVVVVVVGCDVVGWVVGWVVGSGPVLVVPLVVSSVGSTRLVHASSVTDRHAGIDNLGDRDRIDRASAESQWRASGFTRARVGLHERVARVGRR
jgi:hypothetical protein